MLIVRHFEGAETMKHEGENRPPVSTSLTLGPPVAWTGRTCAFTELGPHFRFNTPPHFLYCV